MDKEGVWIHRYCVIPDEGLDEDMTEEEFHEKYGLFVNHYCAPGKLFVIQGEVHWSCHQAASVQ
jgi:hypothetical protein